MGKVMVAVVVGALAGIVGALAYLFFDRLHGRQPTPRIGEAGRGASIIVAGLASWSVAGAVTGDHGWSVALLAIAAYCLGLSAVLLTQRGTSNGAERRRPPL